MIDSANANTKVTLATNDSAKHLESVGAYALLGWLTGTIVPLFGFGIMYFGGRNAPDIPASGEMNLTVLFLLIGLLCSVAGLIAGAIIGVVMILIRRIHWTATIIASPLLGLIWGIVSGGAGGFPVFVVGALFGAIVAAPFGVLGLLTFAALYEPFAHRKGGILGWRKVFFAAVGTLILLMIGELLWFFVINK